ncbi:MAG TPA: cell division protein FtsW [Cryomorphaceae bacterium]|nr:cell division protein FtsW [Owenweeksia sp.]HBF21602.1 cell division protein FtsW [Cryomorphaceae bacterium]HCQ15315.1 cell division protein FtsW [Cryomorphaceae bacterium]|tara:strand:- start:3049 stop:4227 length:1179 start_codon:yes stop_codon:yes gene_type:complete
MAKMLTYIKGDKTLWVIAIILALFSMMPVYSASSNIAFMYGSGNTFSMLAKHAVHLSLGLILMYAAHNMNYRHFGAISVILMPVALLLLVYTLFQGHTVSNATRWIRIPFLGWTFQTSAFASVVLMIYISRYLAKTPSEKIRSFKQSFAALLLPIFAVCGLILPSNFSTAALIFAISMLVLFIGGYPIKNLLYIAGGGIAALGLFIVLTLAFPNMSNRVSTWKARIENYNSGDKADNYQVHKAKMAIAEGQIIGKGPGKSVQKNFLPQSNSDFIYAVIVEEFGLIGGVLVIFFYVLFMIRILIIATKSPTKFGTLVAIGTGLGIIVQAFVNLGVAVNLLPVTGQTLPLISAGGSSIWMTCVAIGIILSVSRGIPEESDEEANVEPVNTFAHA